jgi:hypothetical protein
MPKVYKLSMGGLKKLIAVEKAALMREGGDFGPVRDVEKEPKKTKEVDADELADTLEHEIDYLKAAKVQETKLLKQLKQLRESMRVSKQKIEKAKS